MFSKRSNYQVILLITIIILTLLLVSCSTEDQKSKEDFLKGVHNKDSANDQKEENLDEDIPTVLEEDVTNDFTPSAVPELDTSESTEDQPIYLFLFTHTEDPFNHELSEERYTRLAPELVRIADENPEADLVWNLMFQGSDAKTVSDRDSETGVATMLKSYAADGYIDFGYHTHHDPTYTNRQQQTFNEQSTWGEMVEGMAKWFSCEKDLLYGGCIIEDNGGVIAVENNFGEVKVTSGAGIALATIEGDQAAHAFRKYLPNRLFAFGFPDHGPITQSETLSSAMTNLFEILSPTDQTSLTIIWMDDLIRINGGGNELEAGSTRLMDGAKSINNALESADRSKPHVINVGYATKYIYTMPGTSPTIYGYQNSESPELPEEYLVSESQKEIYYENAIAGLEYLATDFIDENPGSKFVNSEDIEEIFAPPEYFVIDDDQLDILSRWLVLNTKNQMLPNYVSDGENFYSLRDLLVTLSFAISTDFPNSIELHKAYGPTEEISAGSGITISTAEIETIAAVIASDINTAEQSEWQVTPANILDSEFNLEDGTINTAQLLYAMSLYYASNYAGEELEVVNIPSISAMPQTFGYLEEFGCWYCQGSSWSLKPARFYD